jgi:hypothetical protein
MQPWEKEEPHRSCSGHRLRTRIKWVAAELLFGLGVASIIYAQLIYTTVRRSHPRNPTDKK